MSASLRHFRPPICTLGIDTLGYPPLLVVSAQCLGTICQMTDLPISRERVGLLQKIVGEQLDVFIPFSNHGFTVQSD